MAIIIVAPQAGETELKTTVIEDVPQERALRALSAFSAIFAEAIPALSLQPPLRGELVVTQPFGANPGAYSRFGLPGHEGLDLRAPAGVEVLAAANGTAFEEPAQVALGIKHAYGIHVRLRHEVGQDVYHTIYAHLAVAKVKPGDTVQAGQVIGLADSTGNSSGSHLHFAMKKVGATAARETNYPRDLIDPSPFLLRR